MMAANNTMASTHQLVDNAAGGAGFIGIARRYRRNHPVGIITAAALFGAL
jgi:simple sugar transport system permease protein